MTKNKNLVVRLSQEEYELIEQKAKNNDMSVSSYAREKIFYDTPILERSSPEFKMLKTISYCAGVLGKIADRDFKNEEKKKLEQEIKKIMSANGIEIKGDN
ncbi:MAG: hypothetical protein O3B09_02825 [Proteobacteria bacterium]|nr:hypothetical protein [Pseudomonadota bacterium]